MKTILHNFKHLSIEERAKIELLHNNGNSLSFIAKEIGFNKSTISRELKLGMVDGVYQASIAQENANKRLIPSHCHITKLKDDLLVRFIEQHLQEKHSPEIISVLWNWNNANKSISHSSIYNYIATHRPDLNKYLLHNGKHYKFKKGSPKTKILGRVDISERPEIVLKRIRLYDIEVDVVLSRRGVNGCVVTIVDRMTRYLWVVKVENKSAEAMKEALIKVLKGLPIKTITYDNGTENALHMETNKELGCESFFCPPYKSGAKGSIENRNKILRQYFPKRTNFEKVSQEEIDKVVEEINNRPMKVLGWKTPKQAYEEAIAKLQR